MVAPQGELDISTCPALKQALAPLLGGEFDHVIVDLRRVEFMDASAAGLLVGCAERAQKRGVRLSLILGRPGSHRVLELGGLLHRFDVVEDAPAG